MNTQTLNAFGAIGEHAPRGLFARVVAWLDEQRRYRRTVNELSQLTARELEDVGITRAEIDGVARRCTLRR
jgi:uncharacterized protein YjiS (DUF1127 family)